MDHRPRSTSRPPHQGRDVVVEVATRGAFQDFEARLRERRFAEGQDLSLGGWQLSEVLIELFDRERSDTTLSAQPSDGLCDGWLERDAAGLVGDDVVVAITDLRDVTNVRV